MKRSAKLFIILASAVIAFCFAGCVMLSDTYKNGDEYSAGNTEFDGSRIKSLDISWRSGSITVSRHDKDTVTVTESCGSDLKKEQEVHTWLDGKVLHIQFCKSGEPFFFKMSEKKLEIKIPRDMELDELSCSSASGDMFFEDIAADTINCASASGDITIEQKGESSSIKAAASSGDIDITSDKTDKIEANSSSGEIVLRLNSMPAETEAASASGDVKLFVPENVDFTAKVAAASGDFDSDMPLVKEDGRYISGDGSNKINISTASGDISIEN